MDLLGTCGVFVAGLVMGAVNNLAGGGGALGLVALELAGGLPVTAANASLRPAAVAISVGGHAGFRSRALHVPRSAWFYGLLAVPGSIVGSYLVTSTPVWIYRVTLATILCTVLYQQLRPIPIRSATSPQLPGRLLAFLLFPLVGVFMGYVQVGSGLLIILVMTLLKQKDLVQVNAAKMVIVLLSSIASVLYLAVAGQIHWMPALWLSAGAGLGSFYTGRWSVAGGHHKVRIAVLLITGTVLLRQFWLLAFTD